MDLMDRRRFLRSVLGGAVVAGVATTAGVSLLSNVAEAAPVAADKNLPKMMEDFAEKTQSTVVIHRGRRRRRVWRCWWRRGRRVCGWRWV